MKHAILTVSFAFAAFATSAMATEQSFHCASKDSKPNETPCYANGPIERILHVNRVSSKACDGSWDVQTYPYSGASFGFYGNQIWVDKGCRADFLVKLVEEQQPIQAGTASCEVDSIAKPWERIRFTVLESYNNGSFDTLWAKIQVTVPTDYAYVHLVNGAKLYPTPGVDEPNNPEVLCNEGPDCKWNFIASNFRWGSTGFTAFHKDTHGVYIGGCDLQRGVYAPVGGGLPRDN